MQGKIKWFDNKKGYGFIQTDKGDIFIHYSSFKDKNITLTRDSVVSFETVTGEKGLKAVDVEVVGNI